MPITTALVWSAILLWLMILAAAAFRYGTAKNVGAAMFGNRADPPAETAFAGRADRAARNMIENMVLFTAVAAAVLLAGRETGQAQLGAALFFGARLIYWPVYLVGIPYLRTLLWLIAVIGMAMMALALL